MTTATRTTRPLSHPRNGAGAPEATSIAPAPLVTVVMPVYNGAGFLAPAIQSILDQTFADFELIVLDDGSADESLAIINGLASRDARVRVFAMPHVGLAVTMNRGIYAARGKYLARMDGDDLSPRDRLAIHVAYLDAHPDVVAVGGQVLEMDGHAMLLGPMPGLPPEHEAIDAAMMKLDWSIVLGASMMRTQALRDVGGYPSIYPHGDCDLTFRLGEKGRLANVAQTTLHYRRHQSSITMSQASRNIVVNCLKEACERRHLPFAPPAVPADADASPRNRLSTRHRNWAWRALRNGYLDSARKYAWQALKTEPWSAQNWKACLCVLRGR